MLKCVQRSSEKNVAIILNIRFVISDIYIQVRVKVVGELFCKIFGENPVSQKPLNIG